MFGKLFTLYPCAPSEDAEFKLAAYIDETRKVPPLVLSHALKRLVQKRASPYVPSVFEILRESARVLREWKAKAAGREASDWGPEGEIEIDVCRYLERAQETLMQLAAGDTRMQLPERASPEQRAEGAALLDGLIKKHVRLMGM
jgi:hypothetical protein